MKLHSLFLILITLGLLSGCANVMNPYEECFGCPGGDFGSCDDVETAYKKSVAGKEAFSPMVDVDVDVESPVDWGQDEPDKRNKIPVFNLAKQKVEEIKGLINDTLTPMLIPSKKMRLLVFGYQDVTDDFYSHRFIYFIAEKERWALPFNTMGGSSEYADSLFE